MLLSTATQLAEKSSAATILFLFQTQFLQLRSCLVLTKIVISKRFHEILVRLRRFHWTYSVQQPNFSVGLKHTEHKRYVKKTTAAAHLIFFVSLQPPSLCA